jgi:2-haloacid dehalogenase
MPPRRLLSPSPIRAILFDVFGTVVDWHGSVTREGQTLNRRLGLSIDWSRFALDWRAAYAPAMDRVRRGELPWTPLDDLHRQILLDLLPRYGITNWSPAQIDHLNRIWHRLRPWSGTVPALLRLKQKFLIAPLSNGNFSLLAQMAKNAHLPWDCILSAELFRHYKPDPEVYLGAASLLALPPCQIMMVAAHHEDLLAASRLGFSTAFIYRPREFGILPNPATPPPCAAFSCTSLAALATFLGA